MDEFEFWEIIQASLDHPNEDLYQHESLREILIGIGPKKIVEFYQVYQKVFDDAYIGEVWSASLLLNGGASSDDGFKYFRDWLISCGKEVYSNAVINPDSLASSEVQEEVYVDENGFPSAQYEDFGSVAWETYEEVTGKEFDEPLGSDLDETQIDWGDQDHEDLNWLQNRLPNLWSLFGEKITNLEDRAVPISAQINRINVENLGEIIVGDNLNHPEFGLGKLKNITDGGEGVTLLELEFPNHGCKHLVAQFANLTKSILESVSNIQFR